MQVQARPGMPSCDVCFSGLLEQQLVFSATMRHLFVRPQLAGQSNYHPRSDDLREHSRPIPHDDIVIFHAGLIPKLVLQNFELIYFRASLRSLLQIC